jgi:hypothetical protein
LGSGCGSGGGTDPGFAEIGSLLTNFTPATAGPIWLSDNDNCCSDIGRQIAEVIVAS